MKENLQKMIDTFTDKLTEHRQETLKAVLNNRTRHFCMVLEDLFDPHNISAIIRTSEVFGMQDIHIIEEDNPYRIKKAVLKGSFKWLSLYRYKKRARCMEELRKRGYRIAVASTNTTKSILDLDLSKPTAFYMGAEFRGNHPDTLEQADDHFILPQYGITESMNVSVAGGVLMAHLDFWMRQQGRETIALSGEEKDRLLLDWYERSVFGIEKNSPLTEIPD
jgi:tRNA (guanosine-2'-O-)-methyltransferase